MIETLIYIDLPIYLLKCFWKVVYSEAASVSKPYSKKWDLLPLKGKSHLRPLIVIHFSGVAPLRKNRHGCTGVLIRKKEKTHDMITNLKIDLGWDILDDIK